MKVKFFGPLRDLTKEAEIDNIESSDVKSLIDNLISRYGHSFEELLTENGKVRSVFMIVVNGRRIPVSPGIQTKLEKDDHVIIMPMTVGG
jgi:MoaD family protein